MLLLSPSSSSASAPDTPRNHVAPLTVAPAASFPRDPIGLYLLVGSYCAGLPRWPLIEWVLVSSSSPIPRGEGKKREHGREEEVVEEEKEKTARDSFCGPFPSIRSARGSNY